MKNARVWIGTGAALVAAAFLLLGCEDSGITTPSDGTIVLTVNPSTVTIDPNVPGLIDPETNERVAQSSVVARVFAKDGTPVQNAGVIFSTTGGKLATAGTPGQPVQPVTTDASGIARDTLTIRATDPDTIEVSATSSALTQKTQVKKTVVGANKEPTALINTLPGCTQQPCSQRVGAEVVFDGSSSLDTDGSIVSYKWTISSDNPDPGKDEPDAPPPGPTVLGLTRTYVQEQELTVTLEVQDDKGAWDLDSIKFLIRCDNTPPVANGGQDITRTITGSFVVVTLSAVNSTDELPNGIDRYVWTCGNGIAPSAGSAPYEANCRYDAAGTYTARVTVYDKGSTGTIDPDLGTYPCQLSDEDDVIVTITRPTE